MHKDGINLNEGNKHWQNSKFILAYVTYCNMKEY